MLLQFPSEIALYRQDGRDDLTPSARMTAGDRTLTLEQVRADGAECLRVGVTSETTPLSYIRLRWQHEHREAVRVLGDAWERGYGDLAWHGVEPDRMMPWYCLVSNGSDLAPDAGGRLTEGFGVRVRPGAFALWQYDEAGVTLWLDLRCGCVGVTPGGREILCAEVVFGEYPDCSAFEAAGTFCRALCGDPLMPGEPVFGENDWYYAYGEGVDEAGVLADAREIAALCAGCPGRPLAVIDASWSPHMLDAPWTPNERFPDMAALARRMTEAGTTPGIWVSFLADAFYAAPVPGEARMTRDSHFLDPSHPATLAYVRGVAERLSGWGYRLIKHDFSTYDVFGLWGFEMRGFPAPANGTWRFYDRTRTGAEILVGFYRAILEGAGSSLVLACNAVGHLCAGLTHIQRVGDDTSGREWERTRRMGVNTLAFRLPQHGAFFACDADCAAFTKDVPPERVRDWMRLLASSGTPLFVSTPPGFLAGTRREEVAALLRRFGENREPLVPLDWMETACPALWRAGGETMRFGWYEPGGADGFLNLLS